MAAMSPLPRRRTRGAAAALLAATTLLLAGCAASPVAADPGAVAGPAPSGSALDALDRLPVKGRAPKTGYSRAEFGETWADVDGNDCDTRDDVLARDLKPNARKGCTVLGGTLRDPYTGGTIEFRRGRATSSAVQIDHRVALSNAWQTGARQLTPAEREAFANDPANLQATEGAINTAKGDGDAATWLPPAKGYRCTYVAAQVAVKARYRLWVTPPEHDAVARVLATCPAQRLPGPDN